MVNFITHSFNFQAVTGKTPLNILPCPDQIFGVYKNGIYRPLMERRAEYHIDYLSTAKASCKYKRPKSPIVVILESPHIDEYCKCCGDPIGPAQGSTGNLFDGHFSETIKHSSIYPSICNGIHAVVFVNAVQYQCSLGKPLFGKKNKTNRDVRDRNWLKCMRNGCSSDLVKRIDALSPYAIINLCTDGDHHLRNEVELLVKQNFRSIYYTQGNHPSSWWCQRNRKIL